MFTLPYIISHMHTLSHTHTQPRNTGNALEMLRKQKKTRKLLRNTKLRSRASRSAVSILYMSVFHVGDVQWLFLFRLCVPTHFVFFLLLFFFSLTHTQASQVVSMCVCALVYVLVICIGCDDVYIY